MGICQELLVSEVQDSHPEIPVVKSYRIGYRAIETDAVVVWPHVLVTELTIRYKETDLSPQWNNQHTWSNNHAQSHLQEGKAHNATMVWVERLAAVAQKNQSMKLATHLCKPRDNNVLKGDDTFFGGPPDRGLSASPNQCDCTEQSRRVVALELRRQLCRSCTPTLTTRVSTSQQNREKQSLSEGLLNLDTTESAGADGLPPNVSMLVDEYKRTEVLVSS